MKFSIIYEAQMVDTSGPSEQQLFWDIIEQVKLAEDLGFDTIWSVEHHCLEQYAHLSAPEVFLSYVAGMTKRIHVGHGVVCLPFRMNHPVKVAERIATLDILSKGRLHFGVGKGGTPQELGAFQTTHAELTQQVDESMYMIPNMWKEKVFQYKSDIMEIPPRPIFPKPYQDPHPPMYIACTRDETLLIAGERGLGALVLAFDGPPEVERKNKIYREAYAKRDPAKQVGYRPINHLAALCPAIVLSDRDKARRIGVRGQRFFAESIRYWYAGGPPPQVDDLSAEEQISLFKKDEEALVAKLGESNIPITSVQTGNYHFDEDAYGTVDQAIRYVDRLFKAGADEILFLVQMGTVPQDAVMETIENIGKHLIPHFKGKAAA
jgi:alkanesulfonate monooxygenase SsuD/methylene tetrahydromethanopterin reductase-like flavin-dependent oxidoreductase (luciferase family)